MTKRRIWVAVAVVVVVAAGAVIYGFRDVVLPFFGVDGCTAQVGSESVALSIDEAEHAGRIAATSIRKGHSRAATADRLADDERTGLDADDAKVVAAALSGRKEAFSCDVYVKAPEASDRLTSSGLVPRAERVRKDILNAFGDLPLGGYAPGGVSSGHREGSAHYEGRAIDAFFRPINAANKRDGWALAQYLVSQAERLGVRTVIYDDRIWTDSLSGAGWRDYDAPDGPGDRLILEHRDHVHVDVYD